MTSKAWRRVHWVSAAAVAAIVPLGLCTGALDDVGARDAAQRLHVVLAVPVVLAAAARTRRSFGSRLPAASDRRLRQIVERTTLVLLLLLGVSGGVALLAGDTALLPWSLQAAGVDRDALGAVAHRVAGWALLTVLVVHLALAFQDRAARFAAEVVDDEPAPPR